MRKDSVFLFIITLLLAVLFPPPAVAGETLNWEDCLQEAQKNHPDLISAEEVINQDKASKDITAGGLYPQVSADADVSTAKAGTVNTAADSFSFGVSATQLLLDGRKTVSEIKAAAENIKAAEQNYRFVSAGVRLNLRTAFINLLRAQELIAVTNEIIKIRRDNLVLMTMQYLSGLEHKGALLTAEANIARANFELGQANRELELAQRQLTKEMGRREFNPMRVQGDFIVRDVVLDKPDFEALVKNNPAILRAAAEKNAAAFGVKSAAADFYPQLSGRAGADKKNSHWPPSDDQWDIGLAVTLPLFEGGLRRAQLSRARSLFKQTEADERSIRDGVVVNLEKTWAALQDALANLDVQAKALAAAEERSRIAEAQYSTGFISFDNWIIIENELVQSKKAYLQAQAEALFAEANWIYAKGETIEYAD